LMDCNMPVMDGWQATEQIRMRERKKLSEYLPIVAVTANAMKGDRDKCIACGMSDFLSKPVDRKCLFDIIAKWVPVDHRAAPRSPVPRRPPPPASAAGAQDRPG